MMDLITIKSRLADKVVPEYARASSISPVLAFEEDKKVFLMDDKTIGFGFLCDPLVGADEKIHKRVTGLLNQEFPVDSIMQFSLIRTPDINAHCRAMKNLRRNNDDQFMHSIINERVKFLKRHTMEQIESKSSKGYFNSGTIVDVKLLVTLKIPLAGVVPTAEEYETTKYMFEKVESGLQTVGLRPLYLNADRYLRIMNMLVNWDKNSAWRNDNCNWDDTVPICEQIFDYTNGIEVNRKGIKIGDANIRVISAKKVPPAFFFGDAVKYIGDIMGGTSCVKENYMVTCNIQFPNPEKMKAGLETKRNYAVTQAHGQLTKFVPVLGDKKQSFDQLYDSMKNGNKPIKISFSLTLFCPTEQRLNAATMAVKNVFRESHFELMEDTFIQLPMLINNLPLSTDYHSIKELFRYRSMTTEQAAVLLPIFGEWKGTGTFHSSLISRNGQLMSYSLHDSDTNMNLVVAAESGSGKSFQINELIVSYLSEGAQIWVIDAGKSYKKLCEVIDGDFMEFDDASQVCLNPFELIENYADEEDSIVSMVSAMASASGSLSEWQIAFLKRTMSELFTKHGKDLSIDLIAGQCSGHDDLRARDIGTQLYTFTSEGNYGKYFSGTNTMDFKNRFTVLELDELNGRKHLRLVVLLQLIYQIQQAIFTAKDTNRKRLIIVDEAWDMLKEGEVAGFIEEMYRKARKYGGSCCICTQSVFDLYDNPVGRAIAENSASMYLLQQKSDTIERLKETKRLSMSDGAFELLRTVHSVRGIYSEIFMKTSFGMGVGRLIVGDFQKLLYSTEPTDKADIQGYVDNGLNITDAINSVLRDRGMVVSQDRRIDDFKEA